MKTLSYLFHLLLTSSIFICGFSSCEDNLSLNNPKKNNLLEETFISKEANFQLKKKFGIALANVLSENQEVRKLLKDEALKKIDYDYDILYQLVNDIVLTDTITFENMMEKYLSKDELLTIKEKLPTLTIFVPKLPENSFSAETWDITNDIPIVAIRTEFTNDVPVYNAQGEELIIESYKTPLFPIVVIKENERIIAIRNNKLPENSMTLKNSPNKEIEFVFVDKGFDNTNNISRRRSNTAELKSRSQGNSEPTIPENAKKTFEAYDYCKTNNNDIWQRDYIYYDITSKDGKGRFNLNYKEYIVSFKMHSNTDPASAYNKIADQESDPRLKENFKREHGGRDTPSQSIISPWTDGDFEFIVDVFTGVHQLQTSFTAKADDLFELQTKRDERYVYYTGISSCKTIYLENIGLMEWDISKYSTSILINISEYDKAQTIQKNITENHSYATNFEADLKIGGKLGGNISNSKSTSYTVTTSEGSDDLNGFIINFGDDILINKELTPYSKKTSSGRTTTEYAPNYNNKYTTGWYKIQIAPLRTN